MKFTQIIPLLIFVATLSYLVGNHFHDRDFQRDKAINRIRLNEHADKPHKELKRIPSPDGKVDALLFELEIDSSNSNIPRGYAVYLVPVGESPNLSSLYPSQKVFYANRINGLDFTWKDREFLEISYENGDIFEFQNSWIKDKDCRVEIRIVPKNVADSLSK